MKYKKQFATTALAFSLLISGTNVFAATPQDLGIKNSQQTQKLSRNNRSLKIKNQHKSNTVGAVSVISGDGFSVEIKNLKTKITSSLDVKTSIGTIYSKNGIVVKASDLSVGQKVIIVVTLDKATNILTAKTVKIVTNKA